MQVKWWHAYAYSGCRIHNQGYEQFRSECPACQVWSPPGHGQDYAEGWAARHRQDAHAGEPRVAAGALRTAVKP